MPAILAVTLPFLNEIVALFLVSIAMAYLSYRLRLVSIVGFLLAGVVIGPNALGLVYDQELVDILAEVGVILLLFTIGIEFSLEKLSRLGRPILIGGGLQVGVSVAAVTGALVAFGVAWPAAVFTGCLVALSSTAIVLTLLDERSETDTPSGRLMLAVLIFQDLAIVAMVLVVPMLAGEGGGAGAFFWVLGKAVLVVVAVVVLARQVVPWVLDQIARTRRQELFLLTVVALCFGTAAVTSMVGISLALGAFLAGLVVSESHYREHAVSEILPLRTVFNAVFFASVGMLLDLRFLIDHIALVLAVAAAVIVVKLIITTGSIFALGYPVRIAAGVGLALAQIGEFSFVLERAGRTVGLTPAGLGETGEQTFIAVTVLLMILTPFQLQAAPRFGKLLERTPLRRLGAAREPEDGGSGPPLEDHVIVAGYGPAGRRLVQVLRDTGILFVVVELDPQATRELREQGIPSIVGDASRRHILELAGIERAKLCVVAISDPLTTPRIVQLARYLNPTLQLVVRTRRLADVDPLHELGADVVVPEEMETTVRIFAVVLSAYMIPREEIDRQVQLIRADDYQLVRESIHEAHLMVIQGLSEEGLHTRAVAVREGSGAAGRTLQELALRRDLNLTVLAVRRGSKTIGNPAGDFRVEPGDRLILVGPSDRFVDSADLFRLPVPPEET